MHVLLHVLHPVPETTPQPLSTNEEAAAVDRAYIKGSGVQGMYLMMYYSHNHSSPWPPPGISDYAACPQSGRHARGPRRPVRKRRAGRLGCFMTIPMAVDIRFHKWGCDSRNEAAPDAAMKTTTGFWHFAGGGLAFAG